MSELVCAESVGGGGESEHRDEEEHSGEVAEDLGSGERFLDDDSPPLKEIALSSIVADPRWNCRGPYTEAEIEEAFLRFSKEPMLHPPTVAPTGDGGYQLVSGFLRFEVIRRQAAWSVAWFRVVEGTEIDLYLWNLAENTARRALSGYDLVERVWMLYGRGVGKDRLAQACGYKIRYLNRLLFIRRRAHAELYEQFRQGRPGLTVARMARLVGHESPEQMAELRRSEEHLTRALEIEQGFSEREEEEPEPVEERSKGYRVRDPRAGRRRRRLPPRARVRQLLDLHERATGLDPQYRRGALALLRHLLDGEPLPELVAHAEDVPIE